MNKKTRQILRRRNERRLAWKIKHGVPGIKDEDIKAPNMSRSQYRQWYAIQDRYERGRKDSFLSRNPSRETLDITNEIWEEMKPLGERGAADWVSQHHFLAKIRCEDRSIFAIIGGLVLSVWMASNGMPEVALLVAVIGLTWGIIERV